MPAPGPQAPSTEAETRLSRLRTRGVDVLDRLRRRNRRLDFLLAIRQKYADDRAGYLAAAITYYAFFSLFPLLLVFVSVLGFVLHGHETLRQDLVRSALARFPVVGQDLKVQSLQGSAFGLAFGIAGAGWGAFRVFLATEHAMNQLWGIPRARRPGFVQARLRALVLVFALGVGVVLSAALGGMSAVGAGYALGWKLGAGALTIALDFGLFWVAFKLLTAEEIAWRSLRGGALAAALASTGLQLLGGYYVGHVLEGASGTYGTFALVIGLLSWIYLAVHVTLLAAEGNVVASRRREASDARFDDTRA